MAHDAHDWEKQHLGWVTFQKANKRPHGATTQSQDESREDLLLVAEDAIKPTWPGYDVLTCNHQGDSK